METDRNLEGCRVKEKQKTDMYKEQTRRSELFRNIQKEGLKRREWQQQACGNNEKIDRHEDSAYITYHENHKRFEYILNR